MGIPSATININRASNVFNINDEEAVGGDQSNVNFVFALGCADFKVVDQGVSVGQVIAQKAIASRSAGFSG